MLQRKLRAGAGAFALAAALFASAPVARAQAPTWRQGYVVNKEGRKIEGKILERDDGRVTLDKGNGVKIDFDSSDVKITYTDSGSGAAGPASGRRFVELQLKDGSVVRGEIVDQKGGDLTIKPRSKEGKELQPITVKLADVLNQTNLPDLGPGGEGTEPDLDRWVDFDGRFVFERPGADWKIKRSLSPELRMTMALQGKDAFVTVAVRPLANPAPGNAWLEPSNENVRKVQPECEADLKAEFEKPGSLQVSLGELFGSPVYELRYEGNFPGETTVYQFVELRFAREGLLYVVRGGGEKKDAFKAAEPKLREAFTSFSFLASQGGDDDGYNDLVKGFGIDRPAPTWVIDTRPFDDKEPVLLKTRDGKAEIHVWTQEANGRTETTFVDELLRSIESDNKNKADFKKIDRKPGRRAGLPVETYHWEYFESGAVQKRDFQGVVALVDHVIVRIEGISPIADVAAKQIQGEVQRALENVRFYEPKSARKRLSDSSQALTELARGLEASKRKVWPDAIAGYSEAIKIYPDYARAYFLRAIANLEQKQWKDYRADLEKALELDPRPELQQRAAVLYRQEIDLRVRDKQFPEAAKAWREVMRPDPRNEKLKKDFMRFYSDWWNDLKRSWDSKKPDKARDSLEEVEEYKPSGDKEFDQFLSTCCTDIGDFIVRNSKKEWQKAKSLAEKARMLDGNNARVKDVLRSCEDAKKSLEAPPPPKRK